MKPFTDTELKQRLCTLPQWTLADNALHREFEFYNFAAAFAFMTRVAVLAEAHDHHPDWRNAYHRVTIALTTHYVGYVTERDFALAAAIDASEIV
ncbi:MAG: 4a-hydroxytetrahydrobiopterin dehydratase [Planctomycetota bacterium]|jgi:4a-hydroxytetrahydrobiopterin dehydratase